MRNSRTLVTAVTIFTAVTLAACSNSDEPSENSPTQQQSATQQITDYTISYPLADPWSAANIVYTANFNYQGTGIMVGDLYVGAFDTADLVAVRNGERLELNSDFDIDPASMKDNNDWSLSGIRRDGDDYIVLIRHGVDTANDDRRLGDETTLDRSIFVTVWDTDGTRIIDKKISPTLNGKEQAKVVNNLIVISASSGFYVETVFRDINLILDPLTGNIERYVYTQFGSDSPELETTPAPIADSGNGVQLVRKKIDTPEKDLFGRTIWNASTTVVATDTWNSLDKLGLRAELEGVVDDYAAFSYSKGSGTEYATIKISTGEVLEQSGEQCFSTDDNQTSYVVRSANERYVTFRQFRADTDTNTIRCDRLRGNFTTQAISPQGELYGFGVQGNSSTGSDQLVTSSMEFDASEALKIDNAIPKYIDNYGNGYFFDSVNHENGVSGVFVVVSAT